MLNSWGPGKHLSAALAALLAVGDDLGQAAQEALEYMDQCLGSAFRPGMGRLIPDRMFWAQPDDDEQEGPAGRSGAPAAAPVPRQALLLNL